MVSEVYGIKIWVEQSHLWYKFEAERRKYLSITEEKITNDNRHISLWCWKGKNGRRNNYDVLKSIKNGWITADKYNSEQFRCHTPNTVVVFSNEKPDVKEAVKDRWKILQIKGDDLIDISQRYTNKM